MYIKILIALFLNACISLACPPENPAAFNYDDEVEKLKELIKGYSDSYDAVNLESTVRIEDAKKYLKDVNHIYEQDRNEENQKLKVKAIKYLKDLETYYPARLADIKNYIGVLEGKIKNVTKVGELNESPLKYYQEERIKTEKFYNEMLEESFSRIAETSNFWKEAVAKAQEKSYEDYKNTKAKADSILYDLREDYGLHIRMLKRRMDNLDDLIKYHERKLNSKSDNH